MKSNTKEWIQYASALIALLSGICLVFISFFIKGDVTNNCLIYVGQVLVYSASLYGICLYAKDVITKEINKLKKNEQER